MVDSMPHEAQFGGLRRALAAVVALDAATFYWLIAEARSDAMVQHVAVPGIVATLAAPLVVGAVSAIGCVAAVAFGRRQGELGAGAVALIALALLSSLHAQLFGSPWRHMFFSGVCLAGWVVGLVRARVAGWPEDESFARVGAVALLSAAYFNAGVSKLVFGGVDWLSGVPIQMIVVGQDGLANDTLLGAYRSWVATSPHAAQLFCVLTVVLEACAPAMLFSKVASRMIAVGLIAMHGNIYLLTHIPYVQSIYLLACFGLFVVPDDETPIRALGGRFGGAAAVFSGLALLAMMHQGARFSAGHRWHPGMPKVQEAVRPEADPGRREIGPFHLGEEAAVGWTIRHLDVLDDGLLVVAEDGTGRVDLQINCAETQKTSPYDIGPLHVFYGSGAPDREVERVASAVRTRLVAAVKDGDPCAVVQGWIHEGRPTGAPAIDSRAADQGQSPPIP